MRTNSRWGARALTMVVLTAAVSLSGRVEAQQTGLFPLAPIRRQRVPCSQEDPTYKIYKQQYFGYHPTTWRNFPSGWGAPSPEAPDRARSFRETPVGSNREEEGMGIPPPEEERPGPPQRRPGPGDVGLPQERQRSPFEELPGATPNEPPLPPGTTPPRPPAPGRGPDPFQDLNPRGASVSPSRNRSTGRGNSTAADDPAPELAAPAGQPAQGSASRDGQGGDGVERAGDDRGPLLGLSDEDIVRSDAGSADDPAAGAAATSSATSAPAAQPRRRIFGNLFSSLGASWSRR